METENVPQGCCGAGCGEGIPCAPANANSKLAEQLGTESASSVAAAKKATTTTTETETDDASIDLMELVEGIKAQLTAKETKDMHLSKRQGIEDLLR